MSSPPTLLIATSNPGKVTELRDMLAQTGIEVVGLDAFPDAVEVKETSDTFAGNARLKAVGYATQTGLPSLADDSGLEVAALGGRPGVLSARYGGEDLPFADKMHLLLAEVDAAHSEDRSARFVSSIAVASAGGKIVGTTEGICEGRLADSPRGNGGFGYDPIFVPDRYDETFGELSAVMKAQISHRARAFSQIMPILRRFFAIST
jgi:XTP/dITP diphosphohydrolase